MKHGGGKKDGEGRGSPSQIADLSPSGGKMASIISNVFFSLRLIQACSVSP